jgi:hypothetical protein
VTKEEIYDCWAPSSLPWSKWVKPILFASMDPLQTLPPAARSPDLAAPNLDWIAQVADKTAIVIDIPGAASVELGLNLAEQGYQPVPLYNSAPGPSGSFTLDPAGLVNFGSATAPEIPISLLDMQPIMQALREGAPRVKKLSLSPDCAPAFLLDSRRRTGEGAPMEGRFDNRSVSFPTDFPSANFLLANGIKSAILVQAAGRLPQHDLAHTLLRWQEAGVSILSKDLNSDRAPEAIEVPRPTYFRWVWHRMLTLFGLRRNSLGGFGEWIPEAAAG